MRGEILKLNFLIGIVLMLAFFLLNVSFYSVPTFAVNSTNDNFSVTPDNVSINWTGDMITVTSYIDNLTVVVNNTATEILPQYFASSDYQENDPAWPTQTQWENCFSMTPGPSGMKFRVENATGTYSILTYSEVLNNTNSTTFNLTAYQYCPPGLYSGYFYVFKNGTSTEKAKIAANVSIPVNPNNTFNFTGRYASFMGRFVNYDEENYHSFYFNTTQIENSTGGTIKLTGMTKDIDIFLFSGSSVLKRSINKNSEDEEIEFVPWPSQEIMEIRVYGNISDYSGYVYFTPLSVTNASNTNQEFNDTNPVNFGVLDPNQTSSEVIVNITNIDDQSANDVGETAEIYRVDTWLNKNQAGTYRFLVPGFAEKVKVKVEWTTNTTYNLFLRNVNNALIGNSSEKYKNANKTGSVQEEFVIYTSSISESNDGYWNITVYNLTEINGTYNVTAYVWMPESVWFESDYTNGFDFNSSGGVNSSLNFSVNITVPELNLTNGTYMGFLRYNNTEGWKLNVPFEFQVKAGMLFMNNDNISSSTYTVRDNIGFNRLASNATVLNITYNNTGGYPIYYTETNSSNKLYLTSNTSNYIEFIVDQLPGDGSKINSNTNGTMDIRILINTSKTNDLEGTYTGNITFNTTNATVSSSSYPFRTYVFTMSVILNDDLTVNISSLTPSTVQTPVNASNITANVNVKLANGSNISMIGMMFLENFSSTMRLTSINVTSKYYDLTNRTQAQAGGVCTGDYCYVNWTLAGGAVGGKYTAKVTAQVNTSQIPNGNGNKILTGTHTTEDSVVVINDEGLYIINKGHIWVNDANPFDEGDSAYYSVYIKNYGPVAASNFKIMFNNPDSCEVSITPQAVNSTCMGVSQTNSSGTTWTVTSIPAYMGENNCSVTWKVTANSVNLNQGYCYMNIGVTSDHANYGNLNDIGVDVYDTTTTTDGGDGDSQQTGAECTSDSDCADTEVCSSGTCSSISCSNGYVTNHKCYSYTDEFLITSYEEKVYVLQGGSNSTKVTVKNQGAYTRTTKFDAVINLTDLTTEVSPTSYSLASGNLGVFEINFSTTNTTEIGYHKVTLKVYMSGNESIKTTKDITLAIQPLEKTKKQINQTYDDLKELFDSLLSQFKQVLPSTEANYTLTNRTYNRLLSMFTDIENKLKAGEYMDAYELLKEANSSLTEFRQQIEELIFEGSQLPFDMLTLVAILVVIVVIGGFLVYLLLPPKKGFHPTVGYTPRKKVSVVDKLKHLFSGVKKLKPGGKYQKTLGQYERSMPVEKERPSPTLPEKPPEEKPYMEGYGRHEESGLSYKKKEMKPKKKWFGK